VLAGADAALGSSTFQVTFTTSGELGDPLPDLMQVFFEPAEGQELQRMTFQASATGELHEIFGVAEGTTGQIQVIQVGKFTGNGHGATADGFPVEKVKINPIGGGNQSEQNGQLIAALDWLYAEESKPGKKK